MAIADVIRRGINSSISFLITHGYGSGDVVLPGPTIITVTGSLAVYRATGSIA
jgi:hypothetical protein